VDQGVEERPGQPLNQNPFDENQPGSDPPSLRSSVLNPIVVHSGPAGHQLDPVAPSPDQNEKQKNSPERQIRLRRLDASFDARMAGLHRPQNDTGGNERRQDDKGTDDGSEGLPFPGQAFTSGSRWCQDSGRFSGY